MNKDVLDKAGWIRNPQELAECAQRLKKLAPSNHDRGAAELAAAEWIENNPHVAFIYVMAAHEARYSDSCHLAVDWDGEHTPAIADEIEPGFCECGRKMPCGGAE